MFKRQLQVSVVKPSKAPQTEVTHEGFKPDYVAHAVVAGKEAVKGAALLMGTYMAADTLRKVTMHIVATKIS